MHVQRAAAVLLVAALLAWGLERAVVAAIEPVLRAGSLFMKDATGGEARYGSLYVLPGLMGLKGRVCGLYVTYPAPGLRADVPDCLKFFLPYYGDGAVIHVPAPGRYTFSKSARMLTFPDGADVAVTFEGAASAFEAAAETAAGRRSVKTISFHAASARLTANAGGLDEETGRAVDFRLDWTAAASGKAEAVRAGRRTESAGAAVAEERGVRFSVKSFSVALPAGYDADGVFPASATGQARVAAGTPGAPGELRLDGLLLDFGAFAFRLLGDVRAAEAGDLFPSASLRLEVTDLAAASASDLVSAALKLPDSSSPERAKAVSAFLRRYAEKNHVAEEDPGAVFLLERPSMGELTFGGVTPRELAGAWRSLAAGEGEAKRK